MNIPVTIFSQPIGQFALANMNAKQIIQIMTTDAHKYDPITFESSGHVQRKLSEKRLSEIEKYAKTPDACFPTAIILSLPVSDNEYTYSDIDDFTDDAIWNLDFKNNTLYIDDDRSNFAMLVDGQHRMYGLKRAGIDVYKKFEIPVVFLFGATLEQQAKIFSIINSKQTQVSYSLVSQLFGIIEDRTYEKVAHDIASAFNQRDDSPFRRKVKMLGTRSQEIDTETLSQGTIVRQIVPLLNNPRTCYVLYESYNDKDDAFIFNSLLNYFKAVEQIWPQEWASKSFILTKTVGFTGLIKAVPKIFEFIDSTSKNFRVSSFIPIFEIVKHKMNEEKTDFTSEHFQSSGQGANKLKKLILEALDEYRDKTQQ